MYKRYVTKHKQDLTLNVEWYTLIQAIRNNIVYELFINDLIG